jgi:hypothetical protein
MTPYPQPEFWVAVKVLPRDRSTGLRLNKYSNYNPFWHRRLFYSEDRARDYLEMLCAPDKSGRRIPCRLIKFNFEIWE